MRKTASGPEGSDKYQVIELRLACPDEMFELPQTDLFSEYRNFLTGFDYCLSELRGRRHFRPLQLEIQLPAGEIDDGLADRMARTLRRYCDHRLRYNRREALAQRFAGISALRLGIPIAVVGLAATVAANSIKPAGGLVHVIADQLGWVLVWIGLWFPLDQLLFYPLSYGREVRALRQIAEAGIAVTAIQPAPGTQPP